MRRWSLFVVLVMMASVFAFSVPFASDVRAATLYVGGAGPGNYTTIQAAIDVASPGDTVFVYSGTYNESLAVNKTLSLIGEDTNATMVVGNGTGSVIHILSNWVNVSGFSVTGGGSAFFDAGLLLDHVHDCHVSHINASSNNWSGLELYYSDWNTIEHNVAFENKFGLTLHQSDNNSILGNDVLSSPDAGLWITISRDNTITRNFVSLNRVGFYIWDVDSTAIARNTIVDNSVGIEVMAGSSGNTLSENNISGGSTGILIATHGNTIEYNTITNCTSGGIYLIDSTEVVVANNTLVNTGISLGGDKLEHWNTHVIDATNTLNGKPVRYLKNVTGGAVPLGTGQVIIANSSSVLVENQDLSNGSVGLQLGFSSFSVISNNTISYNKHRGVMVIRSDNNSFLNNNISSTDGQSIYLRNSHGSVFRGNNITDGWSSGFSVYYSNRTTISDCIISSSRGLGILMYDSMNNTISNATISSNENQGIYLRYSQGNVLVNNTIATRGGSGIILSASDENLVFGNSLSLSNWSGLYVYSSANNTIVANDMVNNRQGTSLVNSNGNSLLRNNVSLSSWFGVWLESSSGNEIVEGAIQGNHDGIRLYHSHNNSVELATIENNSGVGLALTNSFDNTFIGNSIRSNNMGVYGNDSSSGNLFQENDISNSTTEGIVLQNICNGNTIRENNIASNGGYGLVLLSSSGNLAYWNDIIDNAPQALDDRDDNAWNAAYPWGGNYWNDYSGNDTFSGPNQDLPGSDGIGDTPYVIDSDSQDMYPLMSPHGTIQPRPLENLRASLSGSNLENVTITWSLSPDDGSGYMSVIAYRIFRNTTYSPTGEGYQTVTTLPNGTSSFVDSLAGTGDQYDYFYLVCSLDLNGSVSCALAQAAKFTRPLSAGPNLASIPLIQSDESIGTVLQTVEYDTAWYYDSSSGEWKWQMMHKQYGRLTSINSTMGLWVNVTGNCNLTVAGIVPAQTTIHLWSGWNLVSFPSFNSSYSVADLKAEMPVERVEGFDFAPPHFLRVLQDSDVLQAGEGYWVKVSQDAMWVVSNG